MSVTVVGVTGHRKIPRLARSFAERAIADFLGGITGEILGVSALAAGSDQIFARAVLKVGGDLHAVLPCRGYASSLRRPEDRASLAELTERATTVELLDYPEPSGEAFLAAGRRIVELSRILVAVWDGEDSRGKGGTGDVVEHALVHGLTLLVLWPPGLTR